MAKIATISFINDKKMLPGILSFISNVTNDLNFQKSKLMKFEIAYETMISDRIDNAYQSSGTIYIDIELSTSMLEVSLRDMGVPYWKNETKYDPKNINENAEGLEDFLIASMCDCFGSEKLGRDGQREFVQLLLPSPLDADGGVQRNSETSEERVPDDIEVDIRESTSDEKDIISAITCIYDEYRYTYGYERLYYPESFKELIKEGRLRSFLAIGSNGDIAGHYCLSVSDDYPGMPEWASVVVRRPFRGRHIFDRMCIHGIEMAQQSGARAIMTQPTAYHTATQRVAAKYGYTATGFLFQYVYSDIESEYNTDGRRLDLAIAVKFLTESPKGTVYIPKRHEEFIKKIYKNLGAEYEFPEAFMPEQETDIRHEINSLMKNGRVVIEKTGADIKKELSHATGYLRRNKAEMVEMLINMSDPAAPFGYDAALEYGYFFTGILPGGEKGDYLVMQNLFWNEVDSRTVATTGEYTEFLCYLTETVDCIKR